MLQKFFVILLFVATAAVSAQGLPSLQDVRRVTDEVMTKVGAGDIEAGLKAFKHLTIIPEAEFDVLVGQTRMQLPALTSRFGSSIGHEFIAEDKIGASLARIIYINRFEKHAMRWIFYCYRGKTGWVINTFRFDDKWPDLFGS